MLSKVKVKRILDIIKKDNYYKTPVNIEINMKGDSMTWNCETFNVYDFKLNITKIYEDYRWSEYFMKYTKKTFGLDDTWYKLYFDEMTELIILLHEIGHTIHHNSFDDMIDCCLSNSMSETDFYMNLKIGMNSKLAYRKTRNEFKADSIACKIFKKYGVEMLSIVIGKPIKELKREKLMYNLKQNKLNKSSEYILERREKYVQRF